MGGELAGAVAVRAALLLVHVEVNVLLNRHLARLVGGALLGFERRLVREVVAGIGARSFQRVRPFRGVRDQVLEGFANVGVGFVVGIQIVLQLVAEVGKLLQLGAHLGLLVIGFPA